MLVGGVQALDFSRLYRAMNDSSYALFYGILGSFNLFFGALDLVQPSRVEREWNSYDIPCALRI